MLYNLVSPKYYVSKMPTSLANEVITALSYVRY